MDFGTVVFAIIAGCVIVAISEHWAAVARGWLQDRRIQRINKKDEGG